MFFILRVSGGALSTDAKRHLIYGDSRHICLLVITFVVLGPLLWDFLAEFISKIFFKWYLEWLHFWASKFWRCENFAFVKILLSSLDEKIFPSPVTRFFLCNGENTKFRFEWLITCPQTRKKEVKRLVRSWNTSILEQTLLKQTEPTSLIFNKPETVKSYINTSQ